MCVCVYGAGGMGKREEVRGGSYSGGNIRREREWRERKQDNDILLKILQGCTCLNNMVSMVHRRVKYTCF